MTPVHKKQGRPSLSENAKAAAEVEAKADGDRLRDALNQLDLSQNEAAQTTGIPRQWITSIVNGHRRIGREDLRRLGRIGISPEFVLGLSSVHIPPSQSRSMAALEQDVAILLMREVERQLGDDASTRIRHAGWEVSGKEALDSLVKRTVDEARELTAYYERHSSRWRDSAVLLAIATELLEDLNAQWDSIPKGKQQAIKAKTVARANRLMALAKSMRDDAVSSAPTLSSYLQSRGYIEIPVAIESVDVRKASTEAQPSTRRSRK